MHRDQRFSREPTAMKTKSIEIVDIGRGPQIAGHRLTVLDVFYYLHRGHDFDFIQRALPSLSREQFNAVVEYVKEHRDELVEKDRRAEEFIRQGIATQKAKGLYRESTNPFQWKSGRNASRRS